MEVRKRSTMGNQRCRIAGSVAHGADHGRIPRSIHCPRRWKVCRQAQALTEDLVAEHWGSSAKWPRWHNWTILWCPNGTRNRVVRRTGPPLRFGDKERGALPLRSKTFGTNGSRTTAAQGGQISCDDDTAGCRGWSDTATCLGSSPNSRSSPSLSTADGTA